jgi:hypothetical protein
MGRHRGDIFSNQSVELDGNEFVDCVFNNCELVYAGGPPPTLTNNSFLGVKFSFRGCAANTAAFLKAMANPSSGMQNAVKDIFPEIFVN